MKTRLLFLLLVAFSFSGICQSLDREVVASAGNSSQNLDVQIDWTLGEVVTNTISTDLYILTQGFHQSGLIVSAIGNDIFPGLSVRIYPNPAREIIKINLFTPSEDYRILELIDLSGRVRHFEKTLKTEVEINLLTYEKGLYFLRVYDNNGKYFGSYKIVKYGF